MKSNKQNLTPYYSLLQSIEGIIWEAELDDLHFTFVSNYTKDILGYSPEEWLEQPHFWENHIHPDDRTEVLAYYRLQSIESNHYSFEFRMLKADGFPVWIKDSVSVIKTKGEKTLLRGLMTDITKAKQLSELEHLEKNILELYSKNEKSFTDVLSCYLKGVERLFPQMKCSILKVKNGRLYNWVSPSLPKPYLYAIENLPIGENTGSCGTSAFLKEIVIVNDIANDPKWALYKDLTLIHQLRACWSQPIINSEGMVMATLGMYYEEVKTPTKNELNVIERVSTLLKIILENRLKSEIIIENSLLITQSQELAGFGNWRWDIQNDIVTWSKTLFKIYGLNENNFEATFEGYLDLLHPEDRQRITDIISTALVTKSDVEFEERIIRPDGKIRYLTSWSRLKTDSNGLPIEMNGTCLDVTESKKTQEMLKATASRLEALSDAQTSYVVRVGLDGNYTYCNKKYLEDYDWFLHDKDITKTQASTTVQPYHRHLMDAVMQKCAENPNCLFQLEFDKIQKDGGRKPTLGHFIGLTNAEDGKVTENPIHRT